MTIGIEVFDISLLEQHHSHVRAYRSLKLTSGAIKEAGTRPTAVADELVSDSDSQTVSRKDRDCNYTC